jgi:hypothetical protein
VLHLETATVLLISLQKKGWASVTMGFFRTLTKRKP